MKQFFLILSGLALLTGCSSKNDSVEGPVQSRIRIAPSISRVTGLNFDTRGPHRAHDRQIRC